MNLLIGIGIFIVTLLFIEAAYSAFQAYRYRGTSRVKELMRLYTFTGDSDQAINILQTRLLSHSRLMNGLLSHIPAAYTLDNFLQQAGMNQAVGFFILISLAFAAAGLMISLSFGAGHLLSTVVILLTASIPTVFMRNKRKKRTEEFSRKLSDALDLIARALKAGHSFTVGMKMVADEFSGPIGTEFSKTIDEINFGLPIDAALRNLASRVHVPELKFFVVAVIIQQESGGNLAETLENISRILRERFKFYGRVRALSAEGRLSAIILIAIPLFVAGALIIVNPHYIRLLVVDPIGKALLAFGIVMILIGIYSMKNLVNIKV